MANIIDFIKGEGTVVGFIKQALAVGKGATATLNALRDAGMSIRTQTFFQAFNYLSGPVDTGRKYISNVTLNALPSIDRIPKSLTTILKNFSYEVVVSGLNPSTTDREERYVRVITNTLLTKQQVIDIAVSMVEGAQERYGIEADTAKVTELLQNSGGLVIP